MENVDNMWITIAFGVYNGIYCEQVLFELCDYRNVFLKMSVIYKYIDCLCENYVQFGVDYMHVMLTFVDNVNCWKLVFLVF